MNIIIERTDNPKKDCKDANVLLQECLYLLNKVPNRKYRPKSFKESYDLCSAIEKHLKTQEL